MNVEIYLTRMYFSKTKQKSNNEIPDILCFIVNLFYVLSLHSKFTLQFTFNKVLLYAFQLSSTYKYT